MHQSLCKRWNPNITEPEVVNHSPDLPQVHCWRCKNLHPPSACPQYQPGKNRFHKKSNDQTNQTRRDGNPPPAINTFSHQRVEFKPTTAPCNTLPQQLVVPVSLGSWQGKAILNTGSSYTLINDTIWKQFEGNEKWLRPWQQDPLYLADGTTKYPLGWGELDIHLHQKKNSNSICGHLTISMPCTSCCTWSGFCIHHRVAV